MCGIAGIISKKDSQIQTKTNLQLLSRATVHRGPDNTGYSTWSPENTIRKYDHLPSDRLNSCVSFLHNRLSIIGLENNSNQPMISIDGNFAITYNGEIFNFIEIKSELSNLGYEFRTNSDTEVLLNAYIAWGKTAFQKIIGMFAFAILDVQKNTVIIVRDNYGIKPVYYTHYRDTFIFCSEIKGILKIPGFNRAPRLEILHDYLLHGLVDHTKNTFFDNVFLIPPGSYIELSATNGKILSEEKYDSLKIERLKASDIHFNDAANNLRDIFIDSISLHLRSDVAVGALLSGGIDSSSIVAVMRQVLGHKHEIKTFSYVAGDSVYDEEYFADLVIEQNNTAAHKISISPDSFKNKLEDIIKLQDEPFGSTSIIAQHEVFRSVQKNGIKVVLDGQGADELLAGYTPYYSALAAEHISNFKISDFVNYSKELMNYRPHTYKNDMARCLFRILPNPIKKLIKYNYHKIKTSYVIDWSYFNHYSSKNMSGYMANFPRNLSDTLEMEFSTSNLPGLLRYEDRNSMHFSVESRVPFLTPSIVNYVKQLPVEYLISKDLKNKNIFRVAMRDIVPDKILQRRDKIGFKTPENRWLTGALNGADEIINVDYLNEMPFFKTKNILKVTDDIVNNNQIAPEGLWRIINLTKWSEFNNISYQL